MKPKGQSVHDEGFLEYLEDIIGSNQYVEKIEETSKLYVCLALSAVFVGFFVLVRRPHRSFRLWAG